jgi:hypothetical protein|tara:strand:+ start:955 stop:1530 length:576 start_codon:yes stop_codon:yes gene_type:complete
MTKSVIKTFNETEAAIEMTFAKNAAKVYAPFFKAVKDRDIAFEMFKGEKGATDAKLAYDIEHGFRNSNKDYLVGKAGLSNEARLSIISQAKFFADYSVKELQDVTGATLGTAYKNVSIAKNASNPKRGKVSNAKPAAKPADADNAKPTDIKEMAKQIVKTLGAKDAEKLACEIANLVIDAGMDCDKVAANG